MHVRDDDDVAQMFGTAYMVLIGHAPDAPTFDEITMMTRDVDGIGPAEWIDRSGVLLDRPAPDGVGRDDVVALNVGRQVETITPAGPRRWVTAASVVAVLLLVVGVVVAADRDRESVPTAPASAPAVTEPLAPPESVDPDIWPGVVDSLGYRWSRVPHDETVFSGVDTLTEGMVSVTAGGPGFVAVGATGGNSPGRAIADAVVWTSVDGITWSRVPHDDAIFGGEGDQEMTSVTAGGPGLVAAGWDGGTDSGARWTSVDGLTWSRVPHDLADFGDSVTVGGPGLVAVGQAGGDAAVWNSADGVTWSRVLHDDAVFGGTDEASMSDVTVGGPGFVAVGSDGFEGDDAVQGQLANWARDFSGRAAVWTSVDGITWSRVPNDETIFGGEGNQWMSTVTAVGPGLVAVGGEWSSEVHVPVVWTSVDGITWSRVPHDDAVFGVDGDEEISSVTAGGPGVVAVGGSNGDAAIWVATPEN
jgi:hypothetical protein